MSAVTRRTTVFSTRWFDVIAKDVPILDAEEPHYALEGPDCVSVLAVTGDQQVLLVRQYRPALECYTIELPSGHIDPDEAPEEAARRELVEETGYQASALELLAVLAPDTGRISYRLWCYFSEAGRFTPEADGQSAPGP